MIVEDEAVVALHLRQELTKLGHVVAGMATTGEQALRLIEEVVSHNGIHPCVARLYVSSL